MKIHGTPLQFLAATAKLVPIKPGAGFLAGTVPGSTELNRDGQPIGSEWDEYASVVTPEQAETPLAELFADVPQEPLPDHWEER